MVEKPEKSRPRLFLIDGYALIYRSFFALISRPLTTSRGENTSAAWGVTKFIQKILTNHDPDYLGVVMDAGTSHREQRYPAYKATRQKMPDELRDSLPRIERLLEAFRIPVLHLPNHEADDVIGTLALKAAGAGMETVIVSGDKDFYQLVRPHICLLNPGRGGPVGIEEEWVDERNASERLGVPPRHVADYLALIGDSSDNVPGAKGIGPKTAIQLIEKYGPVEEILAHASEITAKRARESLLEHEADVRLSKELVTIMTELPIDLDVEPLKVTDPNHEMLRDLFIELEFHTLARDYAAKVEPQRIEASEVRYEVLDSPDDVQSLIVARARELGYLALDVESSTRDPLRAELVGLSVAFESESGFYLPFAHLGGEGLGLLDAPTNLPPLTNAAMQPLAELLEDVTVRKIGQNLKYVMLVLRRAGITLRGVDFDTMIASYLIDPGRREHGLDSLALQHLDYRTTTHDELCGKGRDEKPIATIELSRVRDYACEDADIALRLSQRFAPQLEEYHLAELFRNVEMPLIDVLAEMEWHGITIDRTFFETLGAKLGRELHLIQEDIWKEAGEQFNINSTPKLREILFDKLQLPVVKKTKTGASTDASVLEELAASGHAMPKMLLEYRQLDKLKGTYVDALPLLVNPYTKRIHTSFNQTVAATGRLSSSDPNLQNIPIRTEIGAELRRGFIPAPGHLFLTADYSQIELRILAHLSGDPAFVEAFRRGIDIHRQTAALVFDVLPEDVNGHMRGAAKTINFATIYGIGPFALAQKLGTSVAEARSFIEQYFTRFPLVRRYLDDQVEFARRNGFVETLSGRRRYIPEINASNFNVRQFGERAATNAPVQGTAADIIKIAMIDISRALRESGSGAKMLLQVHDELVFEVPEGELDSARAMVKQRMENAFALDVPLEVDTGVGPNWLESK